MKANRQAVVALAIVVLGALTGAFASDARAQNYNYSRHNRDRGNWNRSASYVPAGATINVRLETNISTDDAHPGDGWSGTISDPVYSGDRIMIPAGSPVSGVVTSVAQGTHTSRPQLSLAVREVTVNGSTHSMNADTQPIIAGTNRARKLGAIAGGAAVGALIGHGVAGQHHGTLIGGLLGGAAGYGVTRNALRTMQLKPGTELAFTTREHVAMNR